MQEPFIATPLKPYLRVDDLYTIHYFEFTRDYMFSGEKHDFWEIVYIDKGEAGVMADKSGFILQPGEAIFHRPNQYHSIWANGQYTNVVVISFSSRSPVMTFFERKILPFSDKDKDLLAALLKEAREMFQDPLDIVDLRRQTLREDAPPGSTQMVQILVEQLLISLIRSQMENKRESRRSGTSREQHEQIIVDEINQFLMHNLRRKITLDDVCSKMLFSRTYLKTIYKKWTGDSIMHHFLVLKIDEAKKLISEKQYTFSEIAQMLNFCSVHHFSRTFSRIANLTPSEYSNSVQSRKIL